MHAHIASAEIQSNAVIGWDGDKNGVIAHMNGGYHIRRDGSPNIDVSFGISNVQLDPGSLAWYNNEDYLPCLVTQFERDNCTVNILNFGDQVIIGQNTPPPPASYVFIYSRVTIYNHDSIAHRLDPAPSADLVSLPSLSARKDFTVQPGDTAIYDYVIAADRFGGTYPWPTAAQLKAAGTWDFHYSKMRTYWNDKISHIVKVEQLPDPRLINAYKAGYIYTHIVKDPAADGVPNHYELKVGEEHYEDEVFEGDKLAILTTLITIGDTDTLQYLNDFPTYCIGYPQAKWSYPWGWALYLEKTGDESHVRDRFDDIYRVAHDIELVREGPEHTGLIHPTCIYDYDNFQYDNWAALLGLASYKYICDKFGLREESAWADGQYGDLLTVCNTVHKNTIHHFNLKYLPVSMNTWNPARILGPWDGNWAILGNAHWAWDTYLLGTPQATVELDMIDATYTAGFQTAKLEPHNFGAYHDPVVYGAYSAVYNAGYGSTALRGEIYRSEGIYAYQFMLDNGQSGPFCWWESYKTPTSNTAWKGRHPTEPVVSEAFSCPHITGQSTATKVLIDSLIALKCDGSNEGKYGVIIGRGVPNAWVAKEKVIKVSNFPIEKGGRMGFLLKGDTDNMITLTLTGDVPGDLGTTLDLRAFKNNISAVTGQGVQFDNAQGTVTLPTGTTTTTVTLTTPNPAPIPTPTPPPATVTPTPRVGPYCTPTCH